MTTPAHPRRIELDVITVEPADADRAPADERIVERPGVAALAIDQRRRGPRDLGQPVAQWDRLADPRER